MIATDALLIKLVLLIDILPQPRKPPRRGRPDYYPDALFLKALVIMTARGLYKPNTLLAVLDEPPMQPIRAVLTDANGRFSCRRTWERRLERIPETLPARIGLLGRLLVKQIMPWDNHGRAIAMDSTILHASGGVWHKKHRDKGEVPIAESTPKPPGPRADITAGFTGGNYIWRSRSLRYGFRWQFDFVQPMKPTI